MDYEFFVDGERFLVQADWNGKELTVDSGNGKRAYQVTDLGNGRYLLQDGRKIYRVTALKVENKLFVITDNNIYTYDFPSTKDSDSFGAADGTDSDKSKVTAPMPGKVIKLLVAEGDTVDPKQKLVIVEAMKMENPVVAPFKAEVVSVNCTEGELVDSDTLLIELNELS